MERLESVLKSLSYIFSVSIILYYLKKSVPATTSSSKAKAHSLPKKGE